MIENLLSARANMMMNSNIDFFYILLLMGATAGVVIAYFIRVAIKGRAQFDRVDKQGGSSLLSKEVMEGAYWFFQPLGKVLIFCHITANQVSWASLIFGGLAGACLAVGHFGFGAGFAAISSILDALDGIVARVTNQASDAGEVLDTTVDRYVEAFFIGGLVIYYREIPALVLLALMALVGSFMVSYSTAKAEALQIDPPKSNMRRPERAVYLILGAAFSPITIPWLEKIREFPVPIGHPMVIALGLVAVLSNISAVERMWMLAKAVRVKEAEIKAMRMKLAETELVSAQSEEESPHSV